MSRLNSAKLHVTYLDGASVEGPREGRCYTLTHSDRTGDLFLSVGPAYDRSRLRGLWARFLRDEVLGRWEYEGKRSRLRAHCHVSGGLTMGTASLRNAIFVRELPLALEAIVQGDWPFLSAQAELPEATVLVDFHSSVARYAREEDWGPVARYGPTASTPAGL